MAFNDFSVSEWFLILFVTTIATARMTRLVTQDTFPPMAMFREWWEVRFADKGDWVLLFLCHWCFGFWAAIFNIGLGLVSDTATWWWIINVMACVAYAASFAVHHDGE